MLPLRRLVPRIASRTQPAPPTSTIFQRTYSSSSSNPDGRSSAISSAAKRSSVTGGRAVPRPRSSNTNVSSIASLARASLQPPGSAVKEKTSEKEKTAAAVEVQQKEKTAEEQQELIRVPFVPSTDYLKRADVEVSRIFALHRPISTEKAFPTPSSVLDLLTPIVTTPNSVKIIGEPLPPEGSVWEWGVPFEAPPVPGRGDVREAISVRRQRKLKMKKHKYKKLMKRTRNARRRVESQRK